ncbi:MAG: serine/threonine protein kinase [Phycisphaerae bacterium]|nr:serine/threonine protein kinase [Phycisphaerae bacterium]
MATLVPGFTILQHLGRGAGSHIFRAKDLGTGKEIALKRVLWRSPEDDKHLAQTEHEYEIARRLNHPHLRRCLELRRIKEGGNVRELLLVMELVAGCTLERHRPSRPAEAVEIFIGVAQGLAALHAIGLVHCDMKPRNIMLGFDGRIKIIDFGQSCPIGTVKDRVQGTPDFLAPEQVCLDPLDERTDVFGLGATMYWSLTGHGLVTPIPSRSSVPWPANKGSLLRWSGPATPTQLNDKVPPPLSNLVMQACRERAVDRPASMAALIESLQAIQRDCFPEASPPSEPSGDPESTSDGSSSLARSP